VLIFSMWMSQVLLLLMPLLLLLLLPLFSPLPL
jgi:hypothetical protein